MAPADEVAEDGRATVDEEADETDRGEKGALPLHSGVEVVVVGVCLGMLVVVLLLSFEVVVVDTPAVDDEDDLGVVRVLAEGAIVLRKQDTISKSKIP